MTHRSGIGAVVGNGIPSRALSEWVRPDEAAALARVSVPTIYRAMRSGALQAVKLNRLWRTRTDWVEQWLQADPQIAQGGPPNDR